MTRPAGDNLDHLLRRSQTVALAVGALGTVVAAALAFMDPPAFFFAYLFSYVFWVGLSLGAMALLMVHHLVAGRWGFVLQRALEAAVRVLPLMAFLFIPILLGIHELYHWSHAEAVAEDPVLRQKSSYLNVPFFVGRTIFYLVVWIVLGTLLVRRRGDGGIADVDRLRALSGPGLVLYVLTVSFAMMDWGMSLEPHWFSTIYGIVFVVSQGLTGFAGGIVVLPVLSRDPSLGKLVSDERRSDLGTLLFAFVMLWAYVNVSQYLIIWMGNLPEEVGWYVNRTRGGWQWLILLVIFAQFVLPFFLLLSRALKRSMRSLRLIAGLVLVVRVLDLYWWIKPALQPGNLSVSPVDVVAPLAVGGLWGAAFFFYLRRHPLLPQDDPRLHEAFVGHGADGHEHDIAIPATEGRGSA